MHQPPLQITTVAELRQTVQAARRRGQSIGFVPTMGALHAGHVSLVERSCRECGFTVVSIFVNPTQFGPHEDLARYPRNLAADLQALSAYPVDVVFAPTVEEMYPAGCATFVDVGPAAELWEGAVRPGHFRGVATVVLKLLNLALPDIAFFGQKDYQQTVVVRRMVADLNLPVAIQVCPTVREPDGLAMSSRNAYLGPDDRRRALSLSRGLRRAEELVRHGERDADAIRRAVTELIAAEAGVKLDYVAVVDPATMQSLTTVDDAAVVAVAARVGATRLIDNIVLESTL